MQVDQRNLLLAFLLIQVISTNFSLADDQFKKNLDTKMFETKASPTPAEVVKSQKREKIINRSKSVAFDEKLANSEVQKQSVETINSLTLILRMTPVGERRNLLLLNHATALYLFARQKLLNSKLTNPDEEIRKYLLSALRDVNEFFQSPVKNVNEQWRAHNIAGDSALYLDQLDVARMHFLEVLRLNPPADKAGHIGFMVAEGYFDEEKFQEASEFYLKYYDKMNPQLKELTIYKLGWCMVNLKQMDKAEEYLVRISRSKSTSGVGKDAIQDLAFLVTHNSNPSESINKNEAKIIEPEDKIIFLYSVLSNLESQGSIELHTLIINRLFKIEKDPEKIIELSLANLRVQKTLYASRRYFDSFMKLEESLKKLNIKNFPLIFPKVESSVENELQAIMRIYIDTYAGRAKTPEVFTQPQLGDTIKKLFMVYYQYFSNKPNFANVISIWRDICLDLKDWTCVDYVSRVILSKPDKLPNLREKAYLDQIAALDQFLITPNQTSESIKGWKTRRMMRLKEFTSQYQKSLQWVQVAKFYARAENEVNNEKMAYPVFEQIMLKDPTEESFYDLQFIRFKMKENLKVIEDERGSEFIAHGSKVVELYRESALILAKKAKDSGNIDQYRKYLAKFVEYNSDPDKTRIARADFFHFMIDQGKVEDAVSEFFGLPSNEFKHIAYDSLRDDLWKSSVENGNFDHSLRVASLGLSINEKSDTWKQRKILSSIFTSGQFNPKDLQSLSANNREYFLGLCALVKPSLVTAYYSNVKTLSEQEKDILQLAYKVKLDQWQLQRSSELENVFGRDFPFSDKNSKILLPIEKSIAAILFPDLAKMNPKSQAKSVQDNIEKVQNVRTKIVSVIQGKSLDVQKRVLESARDLESNMAKYLLSSPIPKELKENQLAEYNAGIHAAAEEFTQQSQQFELIAVKVREGQLKEIKHMDSRTLPQPDMNQWVWPNGSKGAKKVKWIHELLKQDNQLGALALLDYLRTTDVKFDQDYFSLRSGIILTGKPADALRIYLLEELEKSKQFGVLKSWTSLVKRSLLEVE